MVSVEQVNFYPLKSGRGIGAAALRLGATGFDWDRHWMVTDAGGRFLSQRTHPQLARIVPEIGADELVLRTPERAPLRVPLAPHGAAHAVTVWDDHCEGLDQGDEAAAWVSAIMGQPARLVRVPQSPRRLARAEFAGPRPAPVSFTDGFPILICNRASLEDLNARMPEPVPMERFRPNIVLTGLPAFAEDRIAGVAIGPVRLNLVKPCTRCVITATDQLTGERATNPLPVLRQFRYDPGLHGVKFGENAVVVEGIGALIERGASCEVTYDS